MAVPAVARRLAAIKMRSTEPIEATLCDGKSDALLDHLRSGVLDLVVGVHPVDDRTLESIALMEDELVEPRIVRRQVLLSRQRLMVEYPVGAKFAREMSAGLTAELTGTG